MGSTEEQPSKPISLYDTSSSPSQPLLSKPPPPPPPLPFPSSPPHHPFPPLEDPQPPPQHATPADSEQDSDPTQYLQITYNHSPRSFKDLPFLFLFLLFVLCTFVLGIFSIFHRNTSYSNLSSFTYDSNSTSCTESTLSNSTNLSFSFSFSVLTGFSSSFSNSLIWVFVITLILTVPICFLLLLSLKRYTKQLVYVSLPFFVVMPVFFNVYWFVACTLSSTCSDDFPLVYRILVLIFVFCIIAVVIWIFVVNWHRIELTVEIIKIASDALYRNLGLFVVLPSLTIGLVVYYAPIVVFLVFSRQNGEIVVEESSGEYSCVWKQDGWVPAYFALAILTMLWSAAVMVEAQVFVISGTIAQWYFSKDEPPRRSIRTSLRNAFGPSSGTICLSGLLICAVRVVRAAVDSARHDTPGIVNLVLRCCVNALLSAVDFLNKFTINFVAITGESYCTSARMTYELLKRNLLSAVFVETISTRLLGGIIFVLSAIYAIVVCAILKGVSDLGVDSYFVAALAWLLLIVLLGFFVHVLDNVIDTVYVCYAIDRDRGEVYKQEVHEVYVQLPISRNHRPSLGSTTPGV